MTLNLRHMALQAAVGLGLFYLGLRTRLFRGSVMLLLLCVLGVVALGICVIAGYPYHALMGVGAILALYYALEIPDSSEQQRLLSLCEKARPQEISLQFKHSYLDFSLEFSRAAIKFNRWDRMWVDLVAHPSLGSRLRAGSLETRLPPADSQPSARNRF